MRLVACKFDPEDEKMYDYECPDDLPLEVGDQVFVPSARGIHGFVKVHVAAVTGRRRKKGVDYKRIGGKYHESN